MSGPLEFLHLPPELLIHTLHYSTAEDLLFSVQLTNRYLYDLVRDSSILQYVIDLFYAGFEDNALSNAAFAERLRTLRRSELAWMHLDPVRRSTLSVMHTPSGLYDLSAGIYVLGERAEGRKSIALRYTYLPLNDGKTAWKRIDVGRHIIDFGIAVREHDLIALVTTKFKDDCSGTRVIELILLQLSTGKRHPSAKEPVIIVREQDRRSSLPSVMLEIVGDNLALMLSHTPERGMDVLLVYDWKPGKQKAIMSPSFPYYQGFIFLREDVLLLPNAIDRRLEIYTIGEDAIIPQCFLDLPILAFRHFIWTFTCRAEPNPVGFGSPPKSTAEGKEPPFLSTSKDAIAVFKMILASDGGTTTSSFIAHRSALLKFLPEEPHLFSSFQSVQHINEMGQPVEITISAESVPWEAWGPSTTRWFGGADVAHGYITVTAGQRFVSIDAEADEEPAPLTLRDFNAYNIGRHIHACGLDDNDEDRSHDFEVDALDSPPPRPGRRLVTRPTVLRPRAAFARDYWSQLPYIEVVSGTKHNYSAVLMDEDRILGLRMLRDSYDTTRELEVLHMRE